MKLRLDLVKEKHVDLLDNVPFVVINNSNDEAFLITKLCFDNRNPSDRNYLDRFSAINLSTGECRTFTEDYLQQSLESKTFKIVESTITIIKG